MADGEPKAPSRRRTRRAGDEAPSRDDDSRHVESATERRPASEAPGTGDDRDDREQPAPAGDKDTAGGEDHSRIAPGVAAQRAARFVARLSGRRPESVI